MSVKDYKPRVTVSRKDGRGTYYPYPKSTIKSHIGEKVWVAGRELTIGKDGRVNIPKAVMQAYGRINEGGRLVLGVKKQYRGKDAGARIIQLPEGEYDYDTGDEIEFLKGSKSILPHDTLEYYD